MTKHVYEIRQRQANEHRGPRDGRELGHFSIYIDGVEAEYTNDPMKAYSKCLEQALAEGKAPGGEAERRALQLAEERSVHCLNRIVEHIKDGSLIPGGVPLGAKGLDLSPIKKPKRRDESAAVEAFLNRGNLQGLDKDDRKKRKAQRDETRDHTAEWHERRAKLIARRQQELAELEASTLANPAKAEKYARAIRSLKEEIAALTAPVLAASHGFQFAYGEYLSADTDLVTGDVRIVPCMTNTTCDTARDAIDQVSDFVTLDEFDGAGYSTGGQALDNQAVNIDDANDRAEFDADDEAATLSAGTRSIQGNLLIEFISTLNGSLPLHWIEYAANKTPDGSTFTVVFNAEGILQAADG